MCVCVFSSKNIIKTEGKSRQSCRISSSSSSLCCLQCCVFFDWKKKIWGPTVNCRFFFLPLWTCYVRGFLNFIVLAPSLKIGGRRRVGGVVWIERESSRRTTKRLLATSIFLSFFFFRSTSGRFSIGCEPVVTTSVHCGLREKKKRKTEEELYGSNFHLAVGHEEIMGKLSHQFVDGLQFHWITNTVGRYRTNTVS